MGRYIHYFESEAALTYGLSDNYPTFAPLKRTIPALLPNPKFAERPDMSLRALKDISPRSARQNRLAERANVPQKAVE